MFNHTSAFYRLCQTVICFLFLCCNLPMATKTYAADLTPWYKTAIIYNLDVATFKDGDGDGTGDFEGLIEKLDYLQSLHIDTIWLEPFQPSPRRDDGYDISDFYKIDPSLGTDEDFDRLMTEIRRRHMHIIMDLVVNHTSDQNQWFKAAEQDRHSPYHDWYDWSKKRPWGWDKGMVFPGVQKETWSFDPKAGEYFFHRFYKFEPSLDIQNPAVKQEDDKIITYWLKRGVDGFRLDGVPFMIENIQAGFGQPKHDYQMLADMHKLAQSINSNAIILGEANVPPDDTKNYFGKNGEGMQMMFDFYVNQYLFYALATGNAYPLVDALRDTQKIPAAAQWAVFLRNHDELDLGRLNIFQRAQVFEAFGPEKNMQIYHRGIRRRLAPMLKDDRRRLELAYSLNFSLPGTPVLRYGEEIGMGDNLALPERLSVRTPMQWDDSANAGFTSAAKPFRPLITEGPQSYEKINVADEKKDPSSLLSWIGQLISMHINCPEISLGNARILDSGSSHVLAIFYEYENAKLLVLHNFSDQPQQLHIALKDGVPLFDLFHPSKNQDFHNGAYEIELDAFGYKWLRNIFPDNIHA